MSNMLQNKDSRAKLALALLCGIAIACTVMVITADGNEMPQEDMKASLHKYAQKVKSVDVDKVGILYTAVPKGFSDNNSGNSGRVRLLNYFKEIESRIASEVNARVNDINKIKTKMAKNRALNAKARTKMKKMLLKKMAVNAKIAKRALDKEMAKTAKTFAEQATKANKRNRATIKRNRKLRRLMRKNKRAAKKALAEATGNQQRALAALASVTNAHISKTNSHIAANAGQIKMNAKKARDDLDKANNKFNKKMFETEQEAKKGRSDLAKQAQNMDKKVRAMIGGKIKEITTQTAKEFQDVRTKMASDRHNADMKLKQATTKITAALNAAKVLQNQNYAKTVSDIKAAKREASALVKKAKVAFNVNLMHLRSTVKDQVAKLNGKVTKLQGVVAKNKMEQAKVDNHVNAEVKRMVTLGNKREATLANKDKALRSLMTKNKAANAAAMLKMANQFTSQLDKIRTQMKKDRAHVSRNLKKSTTALYATLKKNMEAQGEVNKKQEAATAAARLDAQDALRSAKRSFAKRFGQLHATVIANDKKADKKVKALAGVVDREAVKDKEGREALKLIQKTNKNELSAAVREAVSAGESRALRAEKSLSKMNKKTQNALNLKITSKIATLRKSIHGSVEDLQLDSAAARKAMKREILYAVRAAATDAKKQLTAVVKWSNGQFQTLDKKLDKNDKAAAEARKALKADVDADKKTASRALTDAVQKQNRALLALKTITAKKIKKTNTNIAAYGNAVRKQAQAVQKQMQANEQSLINKINAARSKAKSLLTDANKASVGRKTAALKFIADSIAEGGKKSEQKFTKLYDDMGKQRAEFDKKLGASARNMQEKIAMQSALYDTRFRKTVKNINFARKKAGADVNQARKYYTTEIAALTAKIKLQETTLNGAVQAVAGEISSTKAQQAKVNRHVDAELKRIERLENTMNTQGRKARGLVLKVINEHKKLALTERTALEKRAVKEIRTLRSKIAKNRETAAKDLTKAVSKLNGALFRQNQAQSSALAGLKGQLGSNQALAARNLAAAKSELETKMTTLTNTVTTNNIKYEVGLNKITNVAHDWKLASGQDRALLRDQIKTIEADLQKTIKRAVDEGEARYTRVQEKALANTNVVQKALSSEVTDRVEAMSNNVFQAVQENRGQIADNYLAFKAYCGASSGPIIDYTGRGQGRGLFSIGDLMQTVAAFSSMHTKSAEGLGAGGAQMPAPFGGKPVKVSTSLSKTNGLVNEWTKIATMIRARWPYGLGRYLLTKAQTAMQKDGLLSIGKLPERDGQFVYVNAHKLGLSNHVGAFGKLASKAASYQNFVAKLAAKLPKKKKVTAIKPYKVPAAEFNGAWNGD